ncbi:hypothetical protein BX616_006914 [Lobosporangium transversale]|nr:hypothetical protein BX616_006914 [Lobosporangium transversale]
MIKLSEVNWTRRDMAPIGRHHFWIAKLYKLTVEANSGAIVYTVEEVIKTRGVHMLSCQLMIFLDF